MKKLSFKRIVYSDMHYFLNFFQLLILASLLQNVVYAQSGIKRTIKGRVIDQDHKPLPYVNVFIKGSFDGDVSDSTGYFKIATTKSGTQIIVASLIGFEQATIKINLSRRLAELKITLKEEAIAMPEATITASSFSSGDGKGVTLKRLEVLTTPGAAADILRALKTFPGLAHIDEGSGLFVRGGDVTETVTILDQATVVHPYRYESPTGGTFGTITPFLVSGSFFSTGGFSAKYGNALSGVLAMESLDMPPQTQYGVNIGLAATSARVAFPIKGKKLGGRFSGNRSSTGLMFRLNGRYSEFTRHPGGTDINLSIHYDYSKTGHLKFFVFSAKNQIGVRVDQPSFDGIYSSDDRNQLYNLQWKELITRTWLVKASLSLNNYRTNRGLGVFQLDQRDKTYKIRIDSDKEFSQKLHLNFGTEHEVTQSNFQGQFPENNVLDPNGDATTIDAAYGASRTGFYTESEIQLRRGIFLKTGFRVDHHNLASEWVFDPRASFFYQLNEVSNLRLSVGLYHQFPEALLYSPGYGNSALKSQRAIHTILGYETQTDITHFRAEVYYKNYDNLIIENEDFEFLNNGRGYARGLDLFLKHGVLFRDKINGWVSYSFLQSQRLQTRETRTGLIEETGPSAFDITHNLTVVGKYSVTDHLSTGITYRFATGRPFTPVVEAELHPEFNFYIPYEGPVNSERLSDFHRVDLSFSYLWNFRSSDFAVFYLGLSNVLNRSNVLGIDYTTDYSSATPRTTNFSRFVYFGVSVSFQ